MAGQRRYSWLFRFGGYSRISSESCSRLTMEQVHLYLVCDDVYG